MLTRAKALSENTPELLESVAKALESLGKNAHKMTWGETLSSEALAQEEGRVTLGVPKGVDCGNRLGRDWTQKGLGCPTQKRLVQLRRGRPVTVPTLRAMKAKGQRITMVTAYDATFARMLDDAGCRCAAGRRFLGAWWFRGTIRRSRSPSMR